MLLPAYLLVEIQRTLWVSDTEHRVIELHAQLSENRGQAATRLVLFVWIILQDRRHTAKLAVAASLAIFGAVFVEKNFRISGEPRKDRKADVVVENVYGAVCKLKQRREC